MKPFLLIFSLIFLCHIAAPSPLMANEDISSKEQLGDQADNEISDNETGDITIPEPSDEPIANIQTPNTTPKKHKTMRLRSIHRAQ